MAHAKRFDFLRDDQFVPKAAPSSVEKKRLDVLFEAVGVAGGLSPLSAMLDTNDASLTVYATGATAIPEDLYQALLKVIEDAKK
jgi:hypothetical protein